MPRLFFLFATYFGPSVLLIYPSLDVPEFKES